MPPGAARVPSMPVRAPLRRRPLPRRAAKRLRRRRRSGLASRSIVRRQALVGWRRDRSGQLWMPLCNGRRSLAAMDIWRARRPGASFGGMSAALLLAEPEPSARSSLSRHLSSDGFAVHDATDGDEALTAVERVRPDLVLLGGGPGGTPVHEVCSR